MSSSKFSGSAGPRWVAASCFVCVCSSVVQEYSPEVREAPLVTFAVAVALAFEENNFVKFFKLLK